MFLRNATDKVKYLASVEFAPPYPTRLILSVSATRTSGIPPSISHLFLRTLSSYKWHLLKDVDAGSLFEQPAHFLARKDSLLKLLDFSEIDKFAACNKSIMLNPREPLQPYWCAMGIFFTDTAQHITKRMSNT